MQRSRLEAHGTPRGRIFYNEADSAYPGWHLQFYDERRLKTVRLHILETEPVRVALAEAAGFLGCRFDELQLEGAEWPQKSIDID